ncbi:hypothetical protein BLNAU_18037 [Blattamonas nauphoetae]|uniref:Uncharacterized protein n=1 Tax=Blattamonas nauphoetae TaxID=2049346 RepID=A0ABQ9XA07_9EUKA|nr:hypothetical protein BLNAU_18037 [Blattamonas nauphoetae]
MISSSFTRFVLHSDNRHRFVPTEHSLLRGDAVHKSEELLNAVRQVKETHSMEKVHTTYHDWKEWVTMLEMVEKGETSLPDLSFLQSRCLRTTLLSLQTKHQLRANPTPIDKKDFADSCRFPTTADTQLRSTAVSAFHHQSSPDPQDYVYNQVLFHGDSNVRHSRQILLTIHDLLTRPPPKSFPWIIRPALESDSKLDEDFQPIPLIVDLNEKFHSSLFDDTDDRKVVAALRRCSAVVQATKSTKCIVDVNAFENSLISGLHSSNPTVQYECYHLFCESGVFHQKFYDPRERRFQTLRTAFYDDNYWARMALLWLWAGWVHFQTEIGKTSFVKETDFDFSGFLAADLSDIQLFFRACHFVGTIILNDVLTMSFQWQMDFLHKFEKRNQMLSRIASDPRLFSKQVGLDLYMVPLAARLGPLLSVFRGCDFPSALTDLVAIESNLRIPNMPLRLKPAIYLNNTSIAPRCRHSFFPMDLMFERFVRDDPDALLEFWNNVHVCSSRKFLLTAYVGLHSLLLRCPPLNLDQQTVNHLLEMLDVEASGQDATHEDIFDLFGLFPPPCLLDTLLSTAHLDSAPIDTRINLFDVVTYYGDYTSPFGACSSLAKVFSMLTPLDSNPEEDELEFMTLAGESVVYLHWLSHPPHFDSPLLCHLPSLAGAQQSGVKTLSSHSGIRSLVTPHIQSDWKTVGAMISGELTPNDDSSILSLCVRYFTSFDFLSSPTGHNILTFIFECLLSPYPALMSAAFEFFHRYVRVVSDAPSSPAIVSSHHLQPSSPAIVSTELATSESGTFNIFTVSAENELRETSTQPIVPPSDTTTLPSPRYSFAMCWNIVFSIHRTPLCTNTSVPPLVLIFLSADLPALSRLESPSLPPRSLHRCSSCQIV